MTGHAADRQDQPLFPRGAEEVRWALDWETGKSPPWEFGFKNTGRPGLSQCLRVVEEFKPAQVQRPLRVLASGGSANNHIQPWSEGLLTSLALYPTLWKSLLCYSAGVLFCAVTDSVEGPKLSLGRRVKGESRVPSLKVWVKMAEGTNSQGQLCPEDSVLWRAALWWPNKEVGGPEGC